MGRGRLSVELLWKAKGQREKGEVQMMQHKRNLIPIIHKLNLNCRIMLIRNNSLSFQSYF